MSVVVNDAALTPFLRSTLGPVGQDLALRVFSVTELAQRNASGSIIGIQSRDLIDGINGRVDGTIEGLIGIVNTPAIHRGFGYPAYHDQNGRPWLTNALRDGFRVGRSPDLHALALELLSADEDALNTIPVLAPGLEGAPERAFVSSGLPAFDCCPQLTVHVQDITDADTTPGGLAAGRRSTTGKKIYVRLVTTIIRCTVDSRTGQVLTSSPSAADLQATAEQTNADAWALYNHIFAMWGAGDFLTLCSNLVFEGARSVVEQGKCAGWTLTLRAMLDGYNDLEVS